jgi:hypothetical protein
MPHTWKNSDSLNPPRTFLLRECTFTSYGHRFSFPLQRMRLLADAVLRHLFSAGTLDEAGGESPPGSLHLLSSYIPKRRIQGTFASCLMPLQPTSHHHGFDSSIVFMDIMITTIFCSPTCTSLCPLPLEFSFSRKPLTTVRAVLRFCLSSWTWSCRRPSLIGAH